MKRERENDKGETQRERLWLKKGINERREGR